MNHIYYFFKSLKLIFVRNFLKTIVISFIAILLFLFVVPRFINAETITSGSWSFDDVTFSVSYNGKTYSFQDEILSMPYLLIGVLEGSNLCVICSDSEFSIAERTLSSGSSYVGFLYPSTSVVYYCDFSKYNYSRIPSYVLSNFDSAQPSTYVSSSFFDFIFYCNFNLKTNKGGS